MESLTLGFGAVLLMGLAFGAGPCNVSCLPYLGPVFLAQDDHGHGTWNRVVPFSLGRLFSYSALGAVAGGIGHAATSWLETGPATLLLGGATVLVGWLLWRRAGKGVSCEGATSSPDVQRMRFHRPKRRGLSLGLFGMGAAMALNPCVPLGTVLLAAGASANVFDGWWLGMGFGIGAVLVPSVLFGIVVAHFGMQIRNHLLQWRRELERGAAAMLMVLGVLTAAGWVQP